MENIVPWTIPVKRTSKFQGFLQQVSLSPVERANNQSRRRMKETITEKSREKKRGGGREEDEVGSENRVDRIFRSTLVHHPRGRKLAERHYRKCNTHLDYRTAVGRFRGDAFLCAALPT